MLIRPINLSHYENAEVNANISLFLPATSWCYKHEACALSLSYKWTVIVPFPLTKDAVEQHSLLF